MFYEMVLLRRGFRDHCHDQSHPHSCPVGRPRRTVDWRVRFAALSLVWGFSFLLIKVGTTGTPPSR
ncbi:hypothetical protein GCM10020295_70410 [Streptomyces cinereospinus]